MPNIVEYHVLDIGVGALRWTNRGRPAWVLGTGFDGDPQTPDGAPNTPQTVTAVKDPSAPTTQINVTWAAPVIDATHAVQTGYRVYANGVQQGADRASGATSYTITGLTPAGLYAVTVRAFNADGLSTSSTPISLTLDGPTNIVTTLWGCSDSQNDHGGTEVWAGWRVYTSSAMTSRANRTGTQRPEFLAYSKDGANLGGTNPNYTSVFNEARADLDTFYYVGTGQTHSARWGIKLYWSNGNENSDKGAITLPHSQAKLDAYTTSQRGLYDAVHYIDPVTSQRRYPDAFAGSNPTQNQELNGQVEGWLHQSARYHDFVMWSMYPPGRQTTPEDPTYNWPSILEADAYNLRLGFLGRCYVRTLAAEAAARSATGDPSFRLLIGCGEVGIGDCPANQNVRPYYITHGIQAGMRKWSARTGLDMPFACWWDNQKNATTADPGPHPQNILGTGTAIVTPGAGSVAVLGEPTATTPSSRVVWQNPWAYNHEYGGTHPGAWSGLPASIVKKTGPAV